MAISVHLFDYSSTYFTEILPICATGIHVAKLAATMFSVANVVDVESLPNSICMHDCEIQTWFGYISMEFLPTKEGDARRYYRPSC